MTIKNTVMKTLLISAMISGAAASGAVAYGHNGVKCEMVHGEQRCEHHENMEHNGDMGYHSQMNRTNAVDYYEGHVSQYPGNSKKYSHSAGGYIDKLFQK